MNKTLILSGMLVLSMTASAAVSFTEPQRIDLPEGAAHPVLSPDARLMLFSSADHSGLSVLDLNTGAVERIDDATGAGFQPAFTTDSKSVVYRTVGRIDGLTVLDARRYNLNNGNRSTISNYSRSTEEAITFTDNTKYALADFNKIRIVSGDKSLEISPVAEAHSYLWASLSPDGSKLLFCEPFQGVFVADADGSNPVRIAAKGDFPAWVDNTTVTFVLSHDDGYVILDSSLMAVDLNDMSTTKITSDNMLVGESSAAAGKVVFSTLDGNIFSVTPQK